jgi:hypothetical protein
LNDDDAKRDVSNTKQRQTTTTVPLFDVTNVACRSVATMSKHCIEHWLNYHQVES